MNKKITPKTPKTDKRSPFKGGPLKVDDDDDEEEEEKDEGEGD